MVSKNQYEEGAAAHGKDAAGAGRDSVADGAEGGKRVEKKNMTTAAGRQRKRNRPSLAPECREVVEEELSMSKGVGGREKKQKHKSQEMKGGGDLLDTSEEMVDEEYESGGEGHCINRNLEERNRKLLGEEVMALREEQRGEGDMGNTLEESEEDSKLLTIRYQGEVKEVHI